jgi:late competence protein required for DNA uptake (superfamily II DNA/RNA helicase)
MKKLDGVRDVLRNTKHRKPTQIFCPRCCSPKIHLNSSLDVWLTPRQYYCENCGYLGILVMELEPEPETNGTSSVKEKQEPNE